MTVGGSGNVLLHAKLSKNCPRRKKIQGGFFEFLSGSSMLFVRSSHVETASWQRPHAVYFQLSVEISIVISLVLHCCTFWMAARSDPVP